MSHYFIFVNYYFFLVAFNIISRLLLLLLQVYFTIIIYLRFKSISLLIKFRGDNIKIKYHIYTI